MRLSRRPADQRQGYKQTSDAKIFVNFVVRFLEIVSSDHSSSSWTSASLASSCVILFCALPVIEIIAAVPLISREVHHQQSNPPPSSAHQVFRPSVPLS